MIGVMGATGGIGGGLVEERMDLDCSRPSGISMGLVMECSDGDSRMVVMFLVLVGDKSSGRE